jgi:hypothetical protein
MVRSIPPLSHAATLADYVARFRPLASFPFFDDRVELVEADEGLDVG